VLESLHGEVKSGRNVGMSAYALFVLEVNQSRSSLEESNAFNYLLTAVRHGYGLAEEALYRVSCGLHLQIPNDIDINSLLKRLILCGSFMAKEDLQVLDPCMLTNLLIEYPGLYFGRGMPVLPKLPDKLSSKLRSSLDDYVASIGQPSLVAEGDAVGAEVPIISHPFFHHLSEDRISSDNLSGHPDHFVMRISQHEDNELNFTLLHLAATSGDTNTVIRLLDHHGASIDLTNCAGETALLLACRSGHGNVAMELMKRGANVNIASKTGETPLHWLCAFKDEECLQLACKMKECRVNVNAKARGLRERSVTTMFRSETVTPLDKAVQFNNCKAVEALLGIGASFTFASLIFSCKALYSDILHLLLDNFQCNSGYSVERLLLLLVQQAIRAANKLHAIIFHGSKYLDALHTTLALLRSFRADFAHLGSENISALSYAASLGRYEIVEYLLRPEFDINLEQARSSDQQTALHQAVVYGSLPTFDLLVESGADYKRRCGIWNALHLCSLAKGRGGLEIAERLLELQVAIDDAKDSFETPFCSAVLHESYDLADFLLKRGAQVNPAFREVSDIPDHDEDDLELTLLGWIVIHCTEKYLGPLRYLLKHLDPCFFFFFFFVIIFLTWRMYLWWSLHVRGKLPGPKARSHFLKKWGVSSDLLLLSPFMVAYLSASLRTVKTAKSSKIRDSEPSGVRELRK
jgi:ankyrin repeat protein